MKKRGQVTAFIIIGLVILVIIASVFIIREGIIQKFFEKLNVVKTLPIQIKPVEDFLSSCVNRVSMDGVTLVASQGGFLNLKEDKLPVTSFTPIPSTLEIISGSDLKTPLWFRETANGIQELNMPSKTDIQNSISQYVNENFIVCINNLTTFAKQGYSFTASKNPETKTEIRDDKIIVSVNYPLEIEVGIANFSISNYNTDVDTSLGKLYNVAKEIMESENEKLFLENRTIAMLIAYDPEIPYSGLELSCNERIWYKQDIELKLKNIIFENTAAISVKDTSADTLKNLEYLQFDALKKPRKDVDVNFMYIPDWPTLIDINPSEGNILKNNQASKKIGSGASSLLSSFVCISEHRFVYDIKYPVLITLRDSKTDLTFQFATEVIIDNNQPRKYDIPYNDIPEINNEICKYAKKEATIYTGTFDENSDLIPLKDVTLTYKCTPAACPLGKSEKTGDEPKLNTKLPLCVNGVIEGIKEGYYPGKTIYSSNQNINQNLIVALEPLYKKKVEIKIIDKKDGKIREPYDSEQISFQFDHQKVQYSTAYNTFLENKNIELLAGEYSITAYVIRNSTWPITTEKQEIENCVDTRELGIFSLFKKKTHCEKIEIPSMSLNYVITGGEVFNHNFTRNDLTQNGDLTLYVLADPIPGDMEAMQNIQLSIYTNQEHPLFRRPEIG